MPGWLVGVSGSRLSQTSLALLACGLGAATATSTAGLDLDLGIFVEPAAFAAMDARVVVDLDNNEKLRFPFTREGRIQLEFKGNALRVSCEGQGIWCPTLELETAEDAPLFLPVLTTLEVPGRIRVRKPENPPDSLVIQGWVRLRSDDEPIAGFEIPTPVAEDGSFVMRSPAGLLDLRIAAEGFAASYRWNILAETGVRGVSASLGTIDLVPGSSVTGFVLDNVDGLPAATAEISLTDTNEAPTGSEDLRRRLLRPRVLTNERGFFQLVGLAPGRYRIEVEKAGRSRAIREPVDVAAQSESVLSSPILLEKPATVRVEITPDLDPNGQPWRIHLRPQQPRNDDPDSYRAVYETDGAVTFEAVPFGPAVLEAFAQDARFHYQQLDIRGDRTVPLELDLVDVRGVATLNGEPLDAELSFAAGRGDSTTLQTDGEGSFRGWIRTPVHNILFLTITGETLDSERSEATSAIDRKITLREPRIRNGRLDLELDLTGIDVFGIVVDKDGAPVTRARIRLHHPWGRASKAETRSDGRFVLPAIEPGNYELTASHGTRGDSDRRRLTIAKGQIPPDERLVLAVRDTVVVAVRSVSGMPVAFAEVAVEGVGERQSPLRRLKTVADGTVEASIAANSSHALIRVSATGHDLWSGCLPVIEEQELVVTLPPPTDSQLSIEMRFDADEVVPVSEGTLAIFMEGGGLVSRADLDRWHRMLGLPDASEGSSSPRRTLYKARRLSGGMHYKIVWSHESWASLTHAACGLRPRPAGGSTYLPPGGEATVSVDVSDFREEE